MMNAQVNFGAASLAVLLSFACSPANSASRADAPGTSKQANPPAAVPGANVPQDPSVTAADRGRIDGDSSAKTWVIIASDFQCPFCKQWHDETFKPFIDQYVRTGKVKVAYVNFPLNIHPNAVVTAEGAMCASAQNRFWQYHDGLFATQKAWAPLKDPRAVLDSIARNVGVDFAEWAKCMDSKRMVPLIMADFDRAAAGGVNSTPSFLIGDQVLAGALPLAEMRPALDAAIAKSGSAPPR